jgi:hypothetical protein
MSAIPISTVAIASTFLSSVRDQQPDEKNCELESIRSSVRNESRRGSIGKQLSLLPDVILTCIWHFFNLKGISIILATNICSLIFIRFGIDHIRFRSCCHYVNDQAHQRNDIGPRSLIYVLNSEDAKNFDRIASLHPYDIYYSMCPKNDKLENAVNIIWSRITSLRRLNVSSKCDPSHILSSQTGLTSLSLRVFSSNIQYCTKLLELTTPLPSVTDSQYLPSSLTQVSIHLGTVRWAFDDDTVMTINHRLPHLTDLTLSGTGFNEPRTLSSLSRWSSLTKLSISTDHGISLDGVVHNGSFISHSPNLHSLP